MFASNKQSDLLRNTNKQTIFYHIKINLGGFFMKAIYSLIVMVMVLGFTACSNSEDFNSDETSLFDSVKNLYGLEVATGAVTGVGIIPSTTLNEMQAVLEALRSGANKEQNCLVEHSDNGYFGGTNEVGQKVVMASEYRAATKHGVQVEDFLLRVELNFNIDNGQVYYLGTDYTYSSDIFTWRANGLSLAPAKNAEGFTYEFSSESFLYFRVMDQEDCLVKVPVLFKGSYNFKTGKGVYRFQLQKGS